MQNNIYKRIVNLLIGFLLSVMLYQIIFIHSNILELIFHNQTQNFLFGGWPILLFLTLILFILLLLYSRKHNTKQVILSIIIAIIGIYFGKLQDMYFVLEIIIFSFLIISFIDFDKIKEKFTNHRINIILNILIGLLIFLYFYIPIMNHLNYRESGLDAGIYGQALWKYSHFQGFSNTIDHYWGIKNMLGDHFEIILIIISPIYWIYSSVLMLHVFNGIVIAIGCYYLYKLSKLKLQKDEIISKLIVIIYLSFTGLQMAFMEGQFYPLVYVSTLIILIVYFIEIQNWWGYCISTILLLSIKENMGLYVLFIGIYLLIKDKKYWKIAFVTSVIGIIYYLISVKAVSFFSGEKYLYFNYGRLGANNLEVLKTLITKPFYSFYVFLTPSAKITTIFLMIGSFGFLIFSTPLIIGIPMFLERFLTSDEHIWDFFMHYNTPFAGLLICSLIYTLSQNYDRKKIKFNNSLFSLSIFVLLATVLININYRSDIIKFFYKARENMIIDQDSKDLNEAVKKIPNNASVSTQNAIVTHLTNRNQIYQMPVNREAEYIVLNSNKDYWLLSKEEYFQFVKNSLNKDYGIYYQQNHTLILKKNYTGDTNVITDTFYHNSSL